MKVIFWALALCQVPSVAAAAAGSVDRVTRQFHCGYSQVSTCSEISQAVQDNTAGLSISFTETLSSDSGEVIFMRQRLLVGNASAPTQVAALKPTVMLAATQTMVYHLTVSGRPQDFSTTFPQGTNDPASLGRFADAIHRETLAALRESRQFVGTQRLIIEQGTALAQEWQSAATGQSTAAVSRVMQTLAEYSDGSQLVGEIELDLAFQEARSDPLNVPRVLVEGNAVGRLESRLTAALGSKDFFEAAAAAADLEGASGLSTGGAAALAAIRGPQGVLDFSRSSLDVPPSPFSSPELLAYAATPEGRGLRAIANQYAATWAELVGPGVLDSDESLMLTAGLALVHQAAEKGRRGDWRMQDGQLYLADGVLKVVRGYTNGFADGLANAAALIPELAEGFSHAAQLLAASPQRQMEAAVAVMKAIPEIPGAIRLAVSSTYDSWVAGDAEQRADMVGRLSADVFIGIATGELIPVLRGMAGINVVRTAPARASLGQSLAALDAKELGKLVASGNLDDGAQAAAKLKGLLQDHPEAALELARLAEIGASQGVGNMGSLITGWDLIDARATRFAADQLLSRGTPLDATEARVWAGTVQELRTKAEAAGGLPGSSGERKVVRAVPRTAGDGTPLGPADAWKVSPDPQSGRYKLKQEQAWSTAIIDPTRGKPAAWETAIAEYGRLPGGRPRADEDFWLVERTIEPTKILVLDDATLGRLGLTREAIRQKETVDLYLQTHAISRLARELGFDAIEAPSALSRNPDLVPPDLTPIGWNLHILDPKLVRE